MGSIEEGAGRLASLSPERRALVEKLLQPQTAVRPADTPIPRRPAGRPSRLSFAQRRLWFLDQLAPGNPLYNMGLATRMSWPLHVPALDRAINAIVARHDILRTIFQAEDGEPQQIVQPALHIPLQVVDLSDLPAATREAEATRLATIEAQTPFNLERGPLIRTTLLKLDETDYVFLLTLHHIVGDGWSMLVFSREMSVLYPQMWRGEPPTPPDLPIQYADFAEWQRGWLTGRVLDEQLAYWRRQLENLPLLQLRTDRPRPRVQAFRGAFHALSVERPLADAVRALSRSANSTVFMTMLAAFTALLHRYTGQTDIVVGSPMAGRTRREVEPLIGFFVNSLVLRGDVSGDPSFQELLRRVQKTALDAFAHQDLPFEMLVEELHPARDASRNPLFQVTFQLFTPPKGATELDARQSPLLVHRGTAMFDLALSLGDNGQAFVGGIEYDTDLFDAKTIERLGAHLLILLDGAVKDPQRRISELPLLPEDERRQLLVEWNLTAKSFAGPQYLDELIDLQLARTPDRIVVSSGQTSLTYRELGVRAAVLAGRLRASGIGPDRLVAICLERSVDMVVALIGVLKAGGAYVPLDPAYPQDRLDFMLADSGASVLITDPSRLLQWSAGDRTVMTVGSEDDAAGDERGGEPSAATFTEGMTRSPSDAAYVIYTSGSTGRPKGVVIDHRAICNHMQWMQYRFPLHVDDRVVQRTPFSFDASVWEFYAPLLAGARLVLAGAHDTDPAAMVSLLRDERITVLQCVPTFLDVLLDEPEFDGTLSLRRVFCGGEALTARTVRRFHERSKAELCNLYGPTEATIDASFWVSSGEVSGVTAPIGRPIANVRLYVLDPARNPVPVGVAGELFIGGEGLARGYLHRSELTAERFIPDPFSDVSGSRLYRTGDVARFLRDGNLEYLGRVDQQVKLRGYRIELGEVENALADHPRVRDAAVACTTNGTGDRRLLACIVSAADSAADRDGEVAPSNPSHSVLVQNLRVHLRQRLPEFMVPDSFVFLDELPRLPNGKVDRQALPRAGGESPQIRDAYVAPGNDTEEALAALWTEVLRVPRVGVHDNFFSDLGGHSLLATQLTSRIRRTFGIEFPLHRLFEAPTIAELAPRVAEAFRDPARRADAAIRRVTGGVAGDFTAIRIERLSGEEENHR
jgi:amino acid adenylation domain-containing protein